MAASAAGGADPAGGPQQLIDRMIAALGGREAIAELRSLSVTADCSGPGGAFRTRVDSLRPDAVYLLQRAGDRSTEVWSTATATWTRSAEGAIEPAPGARSFLRGHEFHLLILELEERFSDHRLGETVRVDGRECRRIEMTDDGGRPASLCVDESGGLPLELEMSPEGARDTLRIRLDDWRQIEGIRYFHSFLLTEGPDRTFTYRYETIEPNAVDALRFVAPAPPGLEQQQAELVEALRRDRRAHLATDAALLAEGLADTVVEVSDGEARIRTRAELESFFRSYFDGAAYEAWEDARAPIVRLSADATQAWVIRTVRVHRREPAAGGDADRRFTSAYTATYERGDGGWKMTSVTSTFAPPA